MEAKTGHMRASMRVGVAVWRRKHLALGSTRSGAGHCAVRHFADTAKFTSTAR